MGGSMFGTTGRFDLRSLGLLDGDPDPAFVHAVDLAHRTTRTEAATLAIADFDEGVVRVRAHAGALPAPLASLAVPLDRSLFGTLGSSSQPFAVTGAVRDPRTRSNPFVRTLAAESLIGAPVFCPAEVPVGYVVAYDTAVRIWSAEDRARLAAAAFFCTQAILLRAALETVKILWRETARHSGMT